LRSIHSDAAYHTTGPLVSSSISQYLEPPADFADAKVEVHSRTHKHSFHEEKETRGTVHKRAAGRRGHSSNHSAIKPRKDNQSAIKTRKTNSKKSLLLPTEHATVPLNAQTGASKEKRKRSQGKSKGQRPSAKSHSKLKKSSRVASSVVKE